MMGWALSFSFSMALTRGESMETSLFTIVGMRCVFGFFLLSPFLWKDRNVLRQGTFFSTHMARGILMAVSMLCTYFGYRMLPGYISAVVGNSGTLWIMIFSQIFLGERIGVVKWLLFSVGIVGVLCVVQPQFFSVTMYVVVLLVGNILYALSLILARYMTVRHERPVTLLFYGIMCPLVLHGGLFAFFGTMPHMGDMTNLMMIGMCGALSQVCYVRAVALVPASFLAPFEYLRLCFFVTLSWFLWGECPTPLTAVGAFLIVLSTALLAFLPLRQNMDMDKEL